ncbi:MAG TPA: c-type cytochrome [Terracidiphilus sp.]|jgi:cytochrome c oxidase cbb3-type subunit 3/ubiquinol-cytochrome c reductase cytochrome c subunit
MKALWFSISFLACALALCATGCKNAPGKPRLGSEAANPEQVTDFATLYGQNCAACHGDGGKHGAAISLANPAYLAMAGVANIQRVTAAGVPGTMMPGFAKSSGGMLTDRQVAVLAQGMVAAWAKPAAFSGVAPPAYASSSPGVAAHGQQVFSTFCARCHGTDGTGISTGNIHTGSLVEPAYLALISDQGLRSFIIAGQPEQGMPDWRSDTIGNTGRALTDQEVTDIVAWLAAHRTATPGQPYQQNPQ